VLPPKYDYAYQFDESGLAPVKSRQKWSYIDKKGVEVITGPFDLAQSFDEMKLAAVNINGLWCFINRQGDFLI